MASSSLNGRAPLIQFDTRFSRRASSHRLAGVSGLKQRSAVTVVARSNREEEARRLALQCREDAAKAEISSQDLEAAVEGNLIGGACK